jgi:transposase
MEKRARRKFSADFKTKVVIEALKERNTIEEIARKYELHPNQITTWKKEFLAHAASVFNSESDKSDVKEAQEAVIEKLYAQIGQREVEIAWLKKKLQ